MSEPFANSEREIISGRFFNYPVDQVFQAWSDPKLIAQWWGPHGFTNTIRKFDFAPGGEWDFTMNGPDGATYENVIVFHQISPQRRIVFEHKPPPHFWTAVTFDAFGDRTKVSFRMLFDDAKTCEAVKRVAVDGNEQNFDRLAAVLGSGGRSIEVNPKLDLVLERVLDIPPNLAWKGWTTPEIIKEWFCPRPWRVVDCKIDLRPGGQFFTVMKSPEGQEFPNDGCFLEVVDNQRLVWTSAMIAGYRPVEVPVSGADMLFTGLLTFEPHGQGTRFKAVGRHKNEEDRKRHEEMGFHEGWGICADQLTETMKSR